MARSVGSVETVEWKLEVLQVQGSKRKSEEVDSMMLEVDKNQVLEGGMDEIEPSPSKGILAGCLVRDSFTVVIVLRTLHAS